MYHIVTITDKNGIIMTIIRGIFGCSSGLLRALSVSKLFVSLQHLRTPALYGHRAAITKV